MGLGPRLARGLRLLTGRAGGSPARIRRRRLCSVGRWLITTYVLAKGVLRASLEDEEVLLNPGSGMYHLLNRTGRSLLETMEAGTSFEDAIRVIAKASGTEIGAVRSDAESFVSRMTDRGLLEEVER